MASGADRSLQQLFSRVGPPVVSALAEHIGPQIHRLANAVTALALGKPPALDTLTYRMVVDFFVTHQDAVPDARSGALVRKPHPDGWIVRVFFLDDAGRPLVGGHRDGPQRSYVVRAFDDELDALFDGRDMVIFA